MSYLSDLLGSAYKEGMTEDEISAALEKVSQSNDAEVNRLKSALSKANSEAADFKKQLRSKQSEEEAHAAEQQAQFDKMMQENNELKRSISLSDKKGKLIAMGYDEKLATETATAMVDGDMDKVMAVQTQFLEAHKKSVIAEQMKGTPRPTVGSENAGTDYSKKISEAQLNGDFTAAAYYTRLQGMATLSATPTETEGGKT